MDFDYSDEQQLLRDSVARFVREEYAFDARKRLIASGQAFSASHWSLFAELGWLALLLPDRRSAPAQTDRTKSLAAHAGVQRRHRLSSAGISHGGRQHAQTAKLVDTESARLPAYSLPCCFKLSPTRRICCKPRASVASLVCTECGPSTNG